MRSRTPLGWSPLETGDIVDIVAPGFASTREEFLGALRFLEDWGLTPRYPKDLFGKHVLCANDDKTRLAHLRRAMNAEDSAAIWALRGGYGSIRLVPELVKLARAVRTERRPKLFIGLSDLTTLHLYFNQHLGWPTLHGPMIDRLGKNTTPPKYSRELKRVIFGEDREVHFEGLKPLNAAARKSESIRAEVTGGNLITLQSSFCTGVHWAAQGRILFFEDIGERGYRIDRVLQQMWQMGVFNNAKAVILGDFTGGREPDGRNLVPRVLKEFAQLVPIPVLKGLRSGHGLVQRPVPFHTMSLLRTGPDSGELICPTGATTGTRV